MATDRHLSDQSHINDDAAPPRYRRVIKRLKAARPLVAVIPGRWRDGSEFHKDNYTTFDLSITTLYFNTPCSLRILYMGKTFN